MTTVPAWPEGPRRPALGGTDVHVWSMELDVLPEELLMLGRNLSTEERARAERFARERDRDRYIAAHGLLRAILAEYLDTSPPGIRFRVGAFGKPSLRDEDAHADIRFNFSHSDGLALCAVTRGREVGVDVERMRAIPDIERIAERFFSAHERAALRAVPAEMRGAAFYACWSRKEAYIKGVGLGLSLALDSFDVSVAPGEPPVLVAVRGADGTAEIAWALYELCPARGYAAALAVDGGACEITRWRWRSSRN